MFDLEFIDSTAQRGGTYPAGTGPIWGTNVVCTSEEDRLVDCGFSSDTNSCTHSNDAGVTCIGESLLLLPLLHGDQMYSNCAITITLLYSHQILCQW